MRSRRAWLGALVLAVALALVGCGSDDGDDGGSDDGAGKQPVPTDGAVDETGQDVVDVAAVDNDFEPEVVTIDPGTTVRWTNEGRNDHNVLPATDGWSDATALPPDFGVEATEFTSGDVYEFTFEEPGTYAYYCSLHGTPTAGMIGTVIVEEGGPPPGGTPGSAPEDGPPAG